MNSTVIVYASISSASLNGTVQIMLNVLMLLGQFNHIYMGVVLFSANIPSFLTKLLLYLQCIIEGFFSLVVIAQMNTKNFTPLSNKAPVNPITCYVLQSGAVIVSFRVMLFSNIVCQSADRFCALVYPKTYRTYSKYYAMFCILVIPGYSILASITRFVSVTLVGGSCQPNGLFTRKYESVSVESLLRYVIPVAVFIPMNVAVIRKLRLITVKKTNTDDNFEIGGMRTPSDPLVLVQNSLFLNTLCLMMQMTLTECIYIALNFLNYGGIIQYDIGSVKRIYFLCCVVLLDSMNPIVSILTIHALRNTAKHHWRCVHLLHKGTVVE